jgi:peptide/nickel transport system substrate-binding protein
MSSGRARRRHTTIRLGSIAGLVALLVAGCGSSGKSSGDTTSGASSKPIAGGDLTIALTADDGCRDPNQTSRHESRMIGRYVVDGLTDQDPKTGKIVPWLATSWDISSDARVYTFHLRTGVTFSDGSVFDAQAVKTAFDGIVALGAKAVLGYGYLAVNYVGTTVVDPSTVTVTFSQPNAQFLEATADPTLGIESPASYQKTPAERCTGDFSGSGPFTQKSYTANSEVVLVKRPGYAWASSIDSNQGDAYVDSVTFKFIPEVSTGIGELLAGTVQIDSARQPAYPAQYTQAQIDQLTSGGAIVDRHGIPGVAIEVPNTTRFPFDDPIVREAYAHAIDRDAYAKTLNDQAKPAAVGVLSSSTPGYVAYKDQYSYDPAKVTSLLTGDGWAKNADGIWAKNGKTLTLVMNVSAQSSGVDLLQALAKKSGFDIEQNLVTAAQSTQLQAAGSWDLGQAVVTRNDPDILRNYFDPAVGNIIAKESVPADLAATVSQSFAKAQTQTDQTARLDTFKDVQDLLVKNDLVFPDDDRELTTARLKTVQGYSITAFAYINLHDLWLSK